MREVVAPLVGQFYDVLGVIPNIQPRAHHFLQYLEWFVSNPGMIHWTSFLETARDSPTIGLLYLLSLLPRLIPLPLLHPIAQLTPYIPFLSSNMFSGMLFLMSNTRSVFLV